MQNGVTFTGGMSPKSTFEIDLALQKLGCRGKCETVFEKKNFSTQTPFRTFHETIVFVMPKPLQKSILEQELT